MLTKLALSIGLSAGELSTGHPAMLIPVQQFSQCTRTLAEISQLLFRQHKEQRTALGITNGNAVMQLFTSSKGTWTLVLTLPDGPSCIAGAGENWQRLIPKSSKPKGTGL